jgi:hypothetical protein
MLFCCFSEQLLHGYSPSDWAPNHSHQSNNTFNLNLDHNSLDNNMMQFQKQNLVLFKTSIFAQSTAVSLVQKTYIALSRKARLALRSTPDTQGTCKLLQIQFQHDTISTENLSCSRCWTVLSRLCFNAVYRKAQRRRKNSLDLRDTPSY